MKFSLKKMVGLSFLHWFSTTYFHSYAMPSDPSLDDFDVKTSNRWFLLIMSLRSGQSPPFLGIWDTGNQYFVRPEALNTLLRPWGDVT